MGLPVRCETRAMAHVPACLFQPKRDALSVRKYGAAIARGGGRSCRQSGSANSTRFSPLATAPSSCRTTPTSAAPSSSSPTIWPASRLTRARPSAVGSASARRGSPWARRKPSSSRWSPSLAGGRRTAWHGPSGSPLPIARRFTSPPSVRAISRLPNATLTARLRPSGAPPQSAVHVVPSRAPNISPQWQRRSLGRCWGSVGVRGTAAASHTRDWHAGTGSVRSRYPVGAYAPCATLAVRCPTAASAARSAA